MTGDPFFTQERCDRCGGDLHVRTMSWFTPETICTDCSEGETVLKQRLRESGRDPDKLEGCGYVPEV